jgi:hypothetical protein
LSLRSRTKGNAHGTRTIGRLAEPPTAGKRDRLDAILYKLQRG